MVTVAERDPVRQLEAQHFGCRVAPLSLALAEAEVIVTATGRDGVLGEIELKACRDGAVLFNVGHSNREIDVDWPERHERRTKSDHVDGYRIGDRTLYLLNRGSFINIAFTGGFTSSDSFDHFSAAMFRGLHWILSGGAAQIPPGLHEYPKTLELEVATAAFAARSRP